MPPALNVDPATLDLNHIVSDKETIRRVNPQRFEMEQLDAIIYEDTKNHVVAGYKDFRADEFWVRGHMPEYPLVPGVVICEAAAQLSSYYIRHNQLVSSDILGFGGMDHVRFRSTVHVGDRLLLIAKATKIHRLQVITDVQGFVGNAMVFHGDIIGVPITRK